MVEQIMSLHRCADPYTMQGLPQPPLSARVLAGFE
jgi:hypothetical protein